MLPEKLDFTIMARIGCTDFQETKTGGKEREPAVPLRFIPAHCKFLDTRDDTTVTTIRELAAVLVSTFWGRGERGIPGNRRATWKLFFFEFFSSSHRFYNILIDLYIVKSTKLIRSFFGDFSFVRNRLTFRPRFERKTG